MFRRKLHILGYLFTAFVLGMLFPESIYPTLTKALAPVMVGLATLVVPPGVIKAFVRV